MNPKKLSCFSGIGRTRRELVELIYITITPGKFESVFFIFKSNSLCRSEKLAVFFCRRNQKGTGGADIYWYVCKNGLKKRVRRCTKSRGVPLMYGMDGGTDCIEYCGNHLCWQ